MYVCMYVCMYVYIYIYIYTHIGLQDLTLRSLASAARAGGKLRTSLNLEQPVGPGPRGSNFAIHMGVSTLLSG